MNEKRRRFKLRNGGIVEGTKGSFPLFIFLEEFQDPGVTKYFFCKGEELFLYNEEGKKFPIGGAFGYNYDIVEELFDEGIEE